MKCRHIIRAGIIVMAGVVSFLYDQPPAQAGAADREAYYYRQKSEVPIEVSGVVKDIKQVSLADSGKDHTVVLLEPDRGKRGRSAYGRVVDLGSSREFRHLQRGDHLMVRGNTARINDMRVILADAAHINDGKTIEVSRDPAFRKGFIWGRPLRDEEVYEYQNIDVDESRPGAHSWYFDSYEYVGYPYQELPPGASAPWARNDDSWKKNKQRRADRFQGQDERYARTDERYARDDRDRFGREAQGERYGRDDRYAPEDRSREARSRDDRFREDRPERQRGMTPDGKSDRQLKRAVEDELTWSPGVDSDKVSVSVRDGVVTLSGNVRHPEQIDSVIDNAYEAGARQVVSNLTTEQR
jgi:hypothetical protein